MKKRISLIAFLLARFLLLFAQNNASDWKHVNNSIQDELPQTTLKVVQLIYDRASRKQDIPQMMKAMMTLIETKLQLSNDSLNPCYDQMRALILQTTDPVDRAVWQSLLGGLLLEPTNFRTTHLLEERMEEGRTLMLQSVEPNEALLRASAKRYRPMLKVGETDARYKDRQLYPILLRRAIASLQKLYDDSLNVRQQQLYHRLQQYYQQAGRQEQLVIALAEEREMSPREFPADSYPPLIQQYGSVETCAELYYLQALSLMRDHPKEAYDLLQVAMKRYPRYARLERLRELSFSILSPSVNVKAKSFYPGETQSVTVTYRNVKRARLHIYRLESEDLNVLYDDYDSQNTEWKSKAKEVNVLTLPLESAEFTEKQMSLPVTIEQEGYYLLQVEVEGSFRGVTDYGKVCAVTVGRCGLLELSPYAGESLLMAVDWQSGAPLPHATIELYKNEQGKYTALPSVTCNTDGVCRYALSSASGQLFARVVTPEHPYMNLVRLSSWDSTNRGERRVRHLNIYTDRSIYRPGQTIYFSGILHENNGEKMRCLQGEKVTVELSNSERKLEEMTLTTNDFGSIATTFTLPTDTKMGCYTIWAKMEQHVTEKLSVQVEEYRRPQFTVKLNPVTDTYLRGDTVWVTGSVIYFNGMPLAHAEVLYRLFGGHWGMKEIGSDTVRTDEQGLFRFPIETAEMEIAPGYRTANIRYSVEVTAGDTESASGRLSLTQEPATLTINTPSRQWLKEVPATIQTTLVNANNEPLQRTLHYEVTADGSGERVAEGESDASLSGVATKIQSLPSGLYTLAVSLTERDVLLSDTLQITLASLKEETLPEGYGELLYAAPQDDGTHYTLYYGTSQPDATLLLATYAGERTVKYWLDQPGNMIQTREIPRERFVDGSLGVTMGFVRRGTMYEATKLVELPKENRQLLLQWSSFRDRLQTGAKEEWTLRFTDEAGRPVATEVMATLYDASLDKISKMQPWHLELSYHTNYNHPDFRYFLSDCSAYQRYHWKDADVPEWQFNRLVWPGWKSEQLNLCSSSPVRVGFARTSARANQDTGHEAVIYNPGISETEGLNVAEETAMEPLQPIPVNIPWRKDFIETAFFYPQLRSNEQGEVQIAFTLPESLTTWHLRLLAHSKRMQYGRADALVVAARPLMLQARLPRFVRQNDRTSLDAILSNQTEKSMKVTVRMELLDEHDQLLSTQQRTVTLAPNVVTPVAFPYQVECEGDSLRCRMVAVTDNFSDGEQVQLPILRAKERITESVSVGMRRAGTKEVNLQSLFNRQSRSATQRTLTVEYTSNPIWLAVEALPTLAQPRPENALSAAAAFYAAVLTKEILLRYPQIKERPLFRSVQPKRVLDSALLELMELQDEGGGWCWFKGMHPSTFITVSVLEMLIRSEQYNGMRNSEILQKMIEQGMQALQKEVNEVYKVTSSLSKGNSQPTELSCHYLYLNALHPRKLSDEDRHVFDALYKQFTTNPSDLTILGKARMAVTLKKIGVGKQTLTHTLLQSLLEYSVESEEMGRYYDTYRALSSWRDYKIPTQSAVIEAFACCNFAPEARTAMEQWLLKQKQTQAWDTSVNTVDAVWALLNGAEQPLKEVPMSQLQLDGQPLDTTQAVPGMKYLKQSFPLKSEQQAPATFTVSQSHDGLSWGAVYADYEEETDLIQAHGTGFTVARKLYVERLQGDEHKWVELTPEMVLKVGEQVKSVIVVTADRDMDFVEVSETRAGCLEPVSQCSGYRWGRGYYFSPKDCSNDYYFDTFAKGAHLLESYSYVTREGLYDAGVVQVKCVYAPAFNGHTAGNVKLSVVSK